MRAEAADQAIPVDEAGAVAQQVLDDGARFGQGDVVIGRGVGITRLIIVYYDSLWRP